MPITLTDPDFPALDFVVISHNHYGAALPQLICVCCFVTVVSCLVIFCAFQSFTNNESAKLAIAQPIPSTLCVGQRQSDVAEFASKSTIMHMFWGFVHQVTQTKPCTLLSVGTHLLMDWVAVQIT